MHEKFYQHFIDTNLYPRELVFYEPTSSISLEIQGKKFINFSANDYLGLAHHPLLIKRSQEFAKRFGVGSASSRSVTGNLKVYQELEDHLASALKKPAALILGNGFQTNFSVLQALLDVKVIGQEPLIFCDKLCHASMLAGILNRSSLQRFRHNDVDHLQKLLEKYPQSTQPKYILVESVYSMEGDQTNLAEIVRLAELHQAFLYVDDAHSIGIYGEHGWGKASEFGQQIDVVMGTFSKALGSFGGFVACSETLRNYLINKCRGLIYSTGLSPMILGAISAALEMVPQLQHERERLSKKADHLREFFNQNGLNYGNSTTHIIPWIIGDAEKTLQVSSLLKEQGIIAATIRPPSVPPGKSRIRFCLSAAHTDEDLEKLMSAIKRIKLEKEHLTNYDSFTK